MDSNINHSSVSSDHDIMGSYILETSNTDDVNVTIGMIISQFVLLPLLMDLFRNDVIYSNVKLLIIGILLQLLQ